MNLVTLLVIVIVSTVQSLFGVGVLLFGTPILILIGYDFIDILSILLPISISINFLQIIIHRTNIDKDFYKKIVIYTAPGIVIFTFLVTQVSINMSLIIGFFLLFVALKNFYQKIDELLKSMVYDERLYLVILGIVHGLTNLGGSLLVAIIHTKNYQRDIARTTTAMSYATFAIFQMATLTFLQKLDISRQIVTYLLAGVLAFILIEKFVYTKIDNERYRLVFAIFLFSSGLLLIGKVLI